MGLEDLTGKAKGIAEDLGDKAKGAFDAAKDAVSSEDKTDKVLDNIADAANKVTGGKFADQIDSARDAADDKLGGK